MNTSLLIVGIIFLVSVLVGYKRGFIKIIASLITTIASIILVLTLSPHVSAWIQDNTQLREVVHEKCLEIVEQAGESVDTTLEGQIAFIEGAQIPDVFRQMLQENNNDEVYSALGVGSFIEYISAYITKIIADVLAFLVVMLVITIAVRIIMKVLGIFGKLPVIGGVNKVAGGALGIVSGLVIVWLLFFVVTLLYNTPVGITVFEDISDSKILTYLYDNNIIMKYITKF